MKKKITFSLLCFAILSNNVTMSYQLSNTLLRALDGVPPAFDGITLFQIGQMIEKIRSMLYGTFDPKTKTRTGLYIFHGKKHTIHELAKLEKEFAKDAQAQRELQAILHEIKKEFIASTKEFMGRVKDYKPLVLNLMQESCRLNNIPNHPMLNWANTQTGQEEASFQKQVTNFPEAVFFFDGLCLFLRDLFQSTPRGQQQMRALRAELEAKARGGLLH